VSGRLHDWRVFPIRATLRGSGRQVFLGAFDDDPRTVALLIAANGVIPAMDPSAPTGRRELRIRGADVEELVVFGPPPDYPVLFHATDVRPTGKLDLGEAFDRIERWRAERKR
jgi:hypothetical protein